MSASRDRFLRSFRALRNAAFDRSLINGETSARKHNDKAGILRNGVSVVAFATLEHFLRLRVSELLSSLSVAGFRFDTAPSNYRSEVTASALDAIRFQSILAGKRGENVPDFLSEALTPFASYVTPTPDYSTLHFGLSKSNLSPEDCKRMLRIFDIEDGWTQIERLTQRIGSSLLDCRGIFDAAARRRHGAAHDPQSTSTSADLQAFIGQGLILACCFDLAASAGAASLMGRLLGSGKSGLVVARDIRLRFLDRTDTKWREWRPGGKRAIAVGLASSDLLCAASKRASSASEMLIVRGSGLRLRRWHTCV